MVLERMDNYRREGLLCDVTIIAEQKEFTAHKGILAATSDYFQALFTTAMIEKTSKKVNVEVSSLIVNELLTFLYTGKTDINESNVIDLLVAADYLVVRELKERCANYLGDLLSTITCLRIYTLALQCNCSVLKVKSESFILNHFQSILEHENFTFLDCSQLECILRHDDLIVDSEEQVYNAICLWVDGREERKVYFDRLFRHVRLCSLTEDFILENIDSEPLVRQNPFCMSLVLKRLQPESFNNDEEIQVLGPRKCLQEEIQGIFVIGGISEGKTTTETFVLSPEDHRWIALGPMECGREEHVVVACKGLLYVIGGMKRTQNIDCYNPSSNTWCNVAHLTQKSLTSAAVCLEDRIFIMGGKDGFESVSWVQCYDPSKNSVQTLRSLTFPRKALCAVALDGEIYVIGGCTYDNDSLNIVEKMNPSDGGEWKQLCPLREHRKYACAETLASKIFVVGGYQDTKPTALNSCEVYSPSTNDWQIICNLVSPRAACVMACVDNQLYVVGGRSDRRSTDTIEYYDKDNNQWCMSCIRLPHTCAWMQGATLVIAKSLFHNTAQAL